MASQPLLGMSLHIAVPPQGQSPQKRVFSPGLSSLCLLSPGLKAVWGLFLPLTPHEPDTNSQSSIKSDEKLPQGGQGGPLLRHVFKLPAMLG